MRPARTPDSSIPRQYSDSINCQLFYELQEIDYFLFVRRHHKYSWLSPALQFPRALLRTRFLCILHTWFLFPQSCQARNELNAVLQGWNLLCYRNTSSLCWSMSSNQGFRRFAIKLQGGICTRISSFTRRCTNYFRTKMEWKDSNPHLTRSKRVVLSVRRHSSINSNWRKWRFCQHQPVLVWTVRESNSHRSIYQIEVTIHYRLLCGHRDSNPDYQFGRLMCYH